MFEVLSNSVFPVFAVAALGMLANRIGFFSPGEANTLSRFVYFIPMPILLFRMLATANLASFDWTLLAIYLVVECLLYALSTALFFYVFRRSFRESFMLGLSTVFANHLLYLLPIVMFRFGDAAAAEMATFVIVDVIFIYSGTLVLLDATSPGGAAPLQVIGRLVRNPQVIAIALGLTAAMISFPLDNGFGVFAEFAGSAASPASLFALGVILASQKGKGDWRVVASVTAIKLVAFPLAMTGVILAGMQLQFVQADMAVLISTAPSAVASFVLAIRYGVPARDVSMAVLVTTILSIFSVSVVLHFM